MKKVLAGLIYSWELGEKLYKSDVEYINRVICSKNWELFKKVKKEYRDLGVIFEDYVEVLYEKHYKSGEVLVDDFEEVRLTKKLFEEITCVFMRDIRNYYYSNGVYAFEL